MAGDRPIIGLGRTLGDVDHVRDPVLALADLPRGPTNRPTSPQTPGQITFQDAAGLHIQRLVDGFSAQLHLRPIGNSTFNRPAICFGEYFLAKQLAHRRSAAFDCVDERKPYWRSCRSKGGVIQVRQSCMK